MQKPPSIYEQIESEFACRHIATEIRYRLDTLGRRVYVRQCLTCGQATSSAIKHSLVGDLDKVPPFDLLLEAGQRALRDERRSELCALNAEQRGAFWDAYAVYLQSPAWLTRRAKVLKRDGYLCQACREHRASQVHHLTYAHVFDEPLFDLVSVCEGCHKELKTKESGNGRNLA
jgi:5-methylcytosine-specific restriction endonuclease McrA